MRLVVKAVIAVAAIALVGALAYAMLVRDWRTGRSELVARHALGVNVSASLISYNGLQEEMKAKYGDRAQVHFQYPPGRTWVELDGNIIYDHTQQKKISDVVGLFSVGPRGASDAAAFPFRIALEQDRRPDRSLAQQLRNRFGKAGYPERLLAFSDSDWSIDRCVPLPRGLGLGLPGAWLLRGKGTACMVSWKGLQPATMLVSVSQAEGDPWLRPFTKWLCRRITEAALAKADPGGRDGPTYAACVLADRPQRSGAQETLVAHAFSVGLYHTLTRLD
ncbi:MAG: hypothetical protein K2Z80_02120 [Xanthobacteraceae bacterium]|nr:hypothetical protein [Xanthobacteraceae bacterium]